VTALQAEPRGTGDAARCGVDALAGEVGTVAILNGDCPLLSARAVRSLVDRAGEAGVPAAIVTTHLDDPRGYGRIVRDADRRIVRIREERDCAPDEAALREVNPGIYAFRAAFFRGAVARLRTDNAQGELYLTDMIEHAAREGGVTDLPWDAAEVVGVNDRNELVACERALMRVLLRRHGENGVTVRRPDTVHVDADVEIASDVTIEGHVQLRGRCRIGAGARIDVGCVLENVGVGAGANLLPYTVATDSAIGERARVGPFANLRPGTELAEDVHIGNFVETKKTRVGRGSKANHLAYLGDGLIGERVNVGAGTIFCNYDGYGKYVTVLEDGVFVGSDSQLVAPVKVGKDGYVATGTTVTMDVPPDALAVGRARQENKAGYAARVRATLKARADAARKK
jgi:bifunctional UDP-N-acetylglucosamine pyrophosphorylase/glucosamine-1-phosphate N-acetyltransferase